VISGYCDIHAHVLPGIDDGPGDLPQTLELARAAVTSGITMIAATPHLRPDFPAVRVRELAAQCQTVRGALERERIPLELVAGAEVSLVWALDASDDELRLASYEQRGADLLIETPFGQTVGLDRILYTLQTKGYRITLAHPERNRAFQVNSEPLQALVEQGILVQVNADSLAGHSGRATTRLARRLIEHGHAHVIASDGHRGNSWRPVSRLADGVDAAARLVGSNRAEWMAVTAPRAILDGAQLSEPPPARRPAKRWGLLPRS
jgi:protein-tyrosine phosphatase